MTATFLTCALLTLLLPWLALVLARRRLGLEPFWYGLVLVGAGAAMVARVLQMGIWLIYLWIFPVPEALTAAEAAGRWDVLLMASFLLGPLIEGTKSYGVVLFDTRMNRGNHSLYGAAVGAGAGLVQAFWVLGAVAWTVLTGQHEASATELWLCLRELLLVVMEASLCALVMDQAARGRRWQALLGLGALHGLALLVAALLGTFWSGALMAALATLAALALLRWQVKASGWVL